MRHSFPTVALLVATCWLPLGCGSSEDDSAASPASPEGFAGAAAGAAGHGGAGTSGHGGSPGGTGGAGHAGATAAGAAGSSGVAQGGTGGLSGNGGSAGSGAQAGTTQAGSGGSGAQAGGGVAGQAGSAGTKGGGAGQGGAGNGQSGAGTNQGGAGNGQSGAGAAGTGGSAEAGAAGAGNAGSGGAGDAGQAGAGDAGQGGTSAGGNAGQAGSGNAGSGNAGSGNAGSGQAGSGQAGSGQAGSGGNAGGGAGAGGGLVVPPLPPLPAGAGTGKTYYVSPGGKDSNDGKSEATPWQTLTRVTSTTFGPGDTVLLEGGASFVGCPIFSYTKVKSTVEAPFTLGAYGKGPFQLTANCTGPYLGALTIGGVNGFVLTDGVIRGNAGGAEYGVLLNNGSGKVSHGVRIQRCDISGFYTTSKKDFGAEIFINGIPYGLDDISLLDNTLHGSDGVTSLDDNGVSGLGKGSNITNVLIQGNTVYDIGGKADGLNGTVGNGILMAGIDGGLAQYNVVHHGGGNTNTCGGPGGLWTFNSNKVIIQYNEVYGMGPAVPGGGGCDWGAFDLDLGVTNSVVQYNYAHDNVGPGFLAFIYQTWSGNTFRYNISQNDGVGADFGGLQGVTTDLAFYNNTLYSKTAASSPLLIGMANGGSIGGLVANNLFVSAGGAPVAGERPWNKANLAGLQFRGNDYWVTGNFQLPWKGVTYKSLGAWAMATGQEMQGGSLLGLTVDPLLQNPGSGMILGGYDPGALSGYLLGPSSPVIGKGLDLEVASGITPGTLDFFGHSIPHKTGTGYNLGADGSP